MNERPLCLNCQDGLHSSCLGDFSQTTVLTCWCSYCRTWLDGHGPFSTPPDKVDV